MRHGSPRSAATVDTPADSGDLDFALPPALEAREPAETHGTGRDDVRLLVGRRGSGEISHHAFRELPQLLEPGDLLVVNDSGTLPAAIDARPTTGGEPLVLHLSTELPDRTWAVEPRVPLPGGATRPLECPSDAPGLRPGTRLRLTGGGGARLLRRHTERLWVAALTSADGTRLDDVPAYLLRHGRPIRYSYTDRDWPLAAYQTVFATRPGSAEMPSAARPFTTELVTALVRAGVQIAPITLHTGVASPEAHEKPYAERFSVPAASAAAVNHAKSAGHRVIAAGTTVVRALESSARPDGDAHATAAWTDLVITPRRGVRLVDGLLTGFHEPRASHLLMLAAIAGDALLRGCYEQALARSYRWHEFGDVNLLLP